MHRILIGVAMSGALITVGVGFAGFYAAVRELALYLELSTRAHR
ncbi:hypothetical protein ACH41H_37315 [Streptomyces sp. NPDC020800]